MKKMNEQNLEVLVTGGAGFIGSALCKVLCSDGFSVTSLDNYHTGSSRNHHSGIEYVTGDTAKISSYFGNERKFGHIFHLGEYARVEQSFSDYQTVLDYNYHSFPAVLEFAKKAEAKLIYSGSSTKFSSGEKGKLMSPYAYTKAQNIEFLKAFSEWYNLNYTIVYFYNAYGDHEVAEGKYSTVVAKFIKLIRSGETELPVTSPGTQLRNFTHVNDIVSGLILAGFEGNGDGYGIGSDEKYSVLDLVNLLGGKPIFKEASPANRMDGKLKVEKTKALGWNAKYRLEDYIATKLKDPSL